MDMKRPWEYTLPLADMSELQKRVSEYSFDSVLPDDYFVRSQEYQEKSLEILRSIEENTANLHTIMSLIRGSNEDQDKIIRILEESLQIAKSATQKEAETRVKNIFGKIHDTVESVESTEKLLHWVCLIYKIISKMIPE